MKTLILVLLFATSLWAQEAAKPTTEQSSAKPGCIRAPKDPKVLYCGSQPAETDKKVQALATAEQDKQIVQRNQEYDKQAAEQAAERAKTAAEAKKAADAKRLDCTSVPFGNWVTTHCQ